VSHRDIKPENFVFESLSSNNIKLIDFGLSSSFISLNESGNKPSLLRMRTPVGTKIYVAPEVYSKDYTEKCDIWSAGKLHIINSLIGVMLYALLCGFPPFYARDDEDIKKKILKGKVKFDMEIWQNISVEARDLITKMLVREEIRPSAK
jgi:calcium-dependent protein kinase